MLFDILNRLGVSHEYDGQTDRRTDGQAARSNTVGRALKMKKNTPDMHKKMKVSQIVSS